MRGLLKVEQSVTGQNAVWRSNGGDGTYKTSIQCLERLCSVDCHMVPARQR